jgi:hypothetical protein
MRNFNIWGTVIDNRLKIDVRCMKCGKIYHTCEIMVPFHGQENARASRA